MIINNKDFVTNNSVKDGIVNLKEFNRIRELFGEVSGEIKFHLSGEVSDKKIPILKTRIYGKIRVLCQVCLTNLEIDIDHNWLTAIFNSEEDVDNALFGEESSHEDAILANPEFSVLDFIEDELIMFLPISPKHGTCVDGSYKDESASPFKALKTLVN